MTRDNQELMAQKAIKAVLAPEGLKETKGKWASPETLANTVLKEPQATEARRGTEEYKEYEDLRESLGWMGAMATKVWFNNKQQQFLASTQFG